MLHGLLRLHLQNTSSMKKLLRIQDANLTELSQGLIILLLVGLVRLHS